MKSKAISLAVALLTFLATIRSVDATFVMSVRESALDKLAQRIGPINGSGHHEVDAPYPCFVCTKRKFGICIWGYFTTCTFTIFSANWSWTISGVTFDISPSGITYAGQLNASYGFLSYSAAVSGSAGVSVTGNVLRLDLSRISIPVGFNVPGAGFVTVTHINRTLPYGMTAPLEGVGLRTYPPGGPRTIRGTFRSLTREYHNDEVRIRGDVVFW